MDVQKKSLIEIAPVPALVITRRLEAPRAQAFKAWLDPKQLAVWFAPKGFRLPLDKVEATADGRFTMVMEGPDHSGQVMYGGYHQVDEPRRLVMGTWLKDAEGHFLESRIEAVFEEDGTQACRMTVTVELVVAKVKAAPYVVGMALGWRQCLDKLEGYLVSGVESFCTSRAFRAPLELLWQVHTEPAHLVRWMGPAGATVFATALDFRPGGIYHYGLRTAEGVEMWGLWRYRDIEAPRKLVYVQAFSNKDRGLARHPLSPTWPLETLVHVDFLELGSGMSAVSLSCAPYHSGEAEVRTFDGAREGMTGGFKSTLEALENYLSTLV